MPSRQELRAVFMDTLKFFREDETLSKAIVHTNENTKIFQADFSVESEAHKDGRISVIKGRTLQTALKVAREFPGMKIAVLNFANSLHRGGGVCHGSMAQEESICRSSTLYPSLETKVATRGFYHFHHLGDFGWKASDTCIYSPDVIICRDDSDEIPARLTPEEFVAVDVITCAAPHIFTDVTISDDELFTIHLRRAENIMRSAAFNGVDIFIAGAFGCGAFHNPPEIVARAWKEALKVYREKFHEVIFAIYCREDETENYRVFYDVLI